MSMPIDKIICGDNVEVLKTFPDACIDLTVTSPPYDNLRSYNGYEWDFEALAAQLWRVTKPGGVVVWVVADATINGSETGTSFRQALGFMEIGFRLHDTMIYEKMGATNPDPTRYYQIFEYMFIFSKGSPAVFNAICDRKNKWLKPWGKKIRRGKGDKLTQEDIYYKGKEYGSRFNIWRINNGYGFTALDEFAHDHPAIFPEALAHDHIISWSNPGDLVLDPFCGSGTVPKQCILTDRKYIGIDISCEYVELSERRIESVKLQPKLFSYAGAPFSYDTADKGKSSYQGSLPLPKNQTPEKERLTGQRKLL